MPTLNNILNPGYLLFVLEFIFISYKLKLPISRQLFINFYYLNKDFLGAASTGAEVSPASGTPDSGSSSRIGLNFISSFLGVPDVVTPISTHAVHFLFFKSITRSLMNSDLSMKLLRLVMNA